MATTNIICRYWVMGSCLAGETCIFSHDPTQSASKIVDQSMAATTTQALANLQDTTAFPSLLSDQWSPTQGNSNSNSSNTGNHTMTSPPPGFRTLSLSRPL